MTREDVCAEKLTVIGTTFWPPSSGGDSNVLKRFCTVTVLPVPVIPVTNRGLFYHKRRRKYGTSTEKERVLWPASLHSSSKQKFQSSAQFQPDTQNARGVKTDPERNAHKLSVPFVTHCTCVINALKMLLNLVVSTVGTIISKYEAVGS